MLRKRLLALLLALAMAFALCACGQTADESALPEELAGRKLSDEELLALSPEDPDAMRAAISTVEDAAAWFALREPEVMDAGGIVFDEWPEIFFLPPARLLLTERAMSGWNCFGRDEISRIAAWLLQDDIPGVCTLVEASPALSSGHEELLCIPGDGGWHLINAVKLVTASDEGAFRYQFCEDLSGKIAGWSDKREGERAIVTDLSSGVTVYSAWQGDKCVDAFLKRDGLTMLRELSEEERAKLPDEEEVSRFLAEISRNFGLKIEDAAVPVSALERFGMRRLSAEERTAVQGGRRLSDEELAALDRGDLAALKAALSTPEDVAAWLKLQDFSYMDGAMVTYTPASYRFEYPTAAFMLKPEGLSSKEPIDAYIGRDTINLFAAWLLQDDFDDCGALIVLVPDNLLGSMTYTAVCVGAGGEHVFFNLAAMIDMVTKSGTVENNERLDGLAIRDLGSLGDYIDYVDSSLPVQCTEIALIRDFGQPIRYASYGPWACFEDRACLLRASTPDETVEEYTLRHGARGQEWAFLDFDIDAFPIPDALGGSRLSEAQIKALVGQDVDAVAKKVDTVADLISYLHAAGFSFGGGGDIWQDDAEDDDLTWHFNKTARTANLTRDIDCGATANLVRYVLDGDYERVGFMCHTYLNGDGGGHVYNYIYDGGKYYVLDLTQVTGSRYQPGSLKILEMDDLSKFPRGLRYDFSSMFVGYGVDFAAIYAYDAEQDIPIGWGKGEDGCTVTWYPTGTELQILYENRENGYSVDFRGMPAATAEAIELARKDGLCNAGYYRADAFPGVEAYGFPAAFGQATMSYDEMLQLAWTADMETLAARIKTIPDLMMFFCAAGYNGDSTESGGGGSDIHLDVEPDGVIWHYNEYAERTRYQIAHGCGQCAATVRYMLDGDYDEVGYLSCTWVQGAGGGHNFNYIKIGGTYYALDMNLYNKVGYAPDVPYFMEIGDDLSAFQDRYGMLYAGGEMRCCYASPLLREIPVGWEGSSVKTSWLPEQYEDEIRILWTTEDEGYTYRFRPLSAETEAYMDRFRAA